MELSCSSRFWASSASRCTVTSERVSLSDHLRATNLKLILTLLELFKPQFLLLNVLELTLQFLQLSIGFLNLLAEVFGILFFQIKIGA